MDGVLVIDKPAGPTSHDVVARRAAGDRLTAGRPHRHARSAGDRRAAARHRARDAARLVHEWRRQGVRRQRFASASPRRPTTPRAAAAALPTSAEGAGCRRRARRAERFARRSGAFEGRFLQTPPPFSAKKVGGTPAYKLARQDESRSRSSRSKSPSASSSSLSYADGLAEVRLVSRAASTCARWRTTSGQRLGCGAHLEGLRRTRAGEFTLDDAVAARGGCRRAARRPPARGWSRWTGSSRYAGRRRQRPRRQAREPWERPAARGPRRGWPRTLHPGPRRVRRPSSAAP